MKPTNETYEITVASPLLRPGVTIRTQVSKRYVETTVRDLMDIVRGINTTSGLNVATKDAETCSAEKTS